MKVLRDYIVTGALVSSDTRENAVPGDQVTLYLNTEANSAFPESIVGTIQHPISYVQCNSATSYNIEYDEADLLGAVAALRVGDVVSVEVTRAVDVVADELDAEIVRATAAEAALQADIDAEIARATAAEIVIQANLDAFIALHTFDGFTNKAQPLKTDLNGWVKVDSLLVDDSGGLYFHDGAYPTSVVQGKLQAAGVTATPVWTLQDATGTVPLLEVAQTWTGINTFLDDLEIGHVSDTTLTRAAAGRLAVEGVNIVTISSVDILTNKTLTSPTINGGTVNDLTALSINNNVFLTSKDTGSNPYGIIGINNGNEVIVGSSSLGLGATKFYSNGGLDMTLFSTTLQMASGNTLSFASNSGTWNGATFVGNQLFSGTVDITGNLTVDGTTLFVDSANNRVGVGTILVDKPLQVKSGENFSLNSTIALAPSTTETIQGGLGVQSGGILAVQASNIIQMTLSGVDGSGYSEEARFTTSGMRLSTGNTLSFEANSGTWNGDTFVGNQLFGGTLGVTGLITASAGVDVENADTTITRFGAGILAVEGIAVPTVSSTDTLSNKTLDNPTITNYTESVVAIGTVTGAGHTLDLTNGTTQTATLTAATGTAFTMPSATAGKSFTIYVTQAAGGTGTCTFTGVLWPGGTAPTMTSTASKVDIFSFMSDGTSWYGSYSQNY